MRNGPILRYFGAKQITQLLPIGGIAGIRINNEKWCVSFDLDGFGATFQVEDAECAVSVAPVSLTAELPVDQYYQAQGTFGMSHEADQSGQPFVDRRTGNQSDSPGVERRQFTNSYSELSPGAQEIALAIDEYKLRHRRRFITYEEMFVVIKELGYEKKEMPVSV